jgi:hypothetical protein
MSERRRGNRILSSVTAAAISVITVAVAIGPAGAQSGPENIVLSFENLAILNEDVQGHYEGWAIVGGDPISTGTFNVNESGQPVELGGGPVIDEFDAGQDISGATAVVITVEPPGDMNPEPSNIKLLAAPVIQCESELVVNVPGRETLETMTTGSYILATPSDNPEVPDNENQGIWFLQTPGPVAGFENLPEIGPDWTYEGWVVDVSDPGNPIPYSTGTFATAEGYDSDEAGPMGGGPPFPGQDFVEFQGGPILVLDTGDFLAVITIEPVPDDLPTPFQLKPLAGQIPTDALGQNNELPNQAAATFPAGLGLLYCPTPVEAVSWGEVKSAYRN